MLASDFSGVVWVALAIVCGVAVACLAGGAIVAGLIVAVTQKRQHWWLTIPLAAVCFAIGWFVMSIYD